MPRGLCYGPGALDWMFKSIFAPRCAPKDTFSKSCLTSFGCALLPLLSLGYQQWLGFRLLWVVLARLVRPHSGCMSCSDVFLALVECLHCVLALWGGVGVSSVLATVTADTQCMIRPSVAKSLGAHWLLPRFAVLVPHVAW